MAYANIFAKKMWVVFAFAKATHIFQPTKNKKKKKEKRSKKKKQTKKTNKQTKK